MKQLILVISAVLLTNICFSQSTYNNEYNIPISKNSWKQLGYDNLIDSINLKQNDGSSWQALEFYADLSIEDSEIIDNIETSSNVLDIINKLGEVSLDIPCKSSTKYLTPISGQYYTILEKNGGKMILIMYPI